MGYKKGTLLPRYLKVALGVTTRTGGTVLSDWLVGVTNALNSGTHQRYLKLSYEGFHAHVHPTAIFYLFISAPSHPILLLLEDTTATLCRAKPHLP